ncbi:hypothetical protein D3C86_1705480 [compost metagenome]
MASYSIRAAQVESKAAQFTVDYQQLGMTWSDGSVKIDPGKRTTHFKLEKTPYGWRITEPFNNWHVSLASALSEGKIQARDRKRLEATAGHP